MSERQKASERIRQALGLLRDGKDDDRTDLKLIGESLIGDVGLAVIADEIQEGVEQLRRIADANAEQVVIQREMFIDEERMKANQELAVALRTRLEELELHSHDSEDQ